MARGSQFWHVVTGTLGTVHTKSLVLAVTGRLGTVHNEMCGDGCYRKGRDSPQRNVWCWLLTGTLGTVHNEMCGVGCYRKAWDSPQRKVWYWLLQEG